jgi:hypothetical protein
VLVDVIGRFRLVGNGGTDEYVNDDVNVYVVVNIYVDVIVDVIVFW